MDCTEPEFWEQRYRGNRTPWDQRGVPAALQIFLQNSDDRGSVLIPGCGSGYEVEAFHRFGWQPSAIDFSPAAVERAHALLGPLAGSVRVADFFTGELGGPHDFIYERTFLCSLPPARWPDYARRVAQLLRPQGRLIGIFVYGTEPEPPPFPLTREVADQILGAHFRLRADTPIPAEQSLPLYAGQERWQVWQRA